MSTVIEYKPYDYPAIAQPDGLGSSVINKTPIEIADGGRRKTFTPNYNYLLNNGTIAASGLSFQTADFDEYDENYEKVVALNLGTVNGPQVINISTN